jgi:SAM-dependent methyltransferase
MSQLRDETFKSMDAYRMMLEPDDKGWHVLEVGIDGDERPSGNYRGFGKGNVFKTLDFLDRLHPDIVADICETKLPPGEWDLIILSNTLEHVFEANKAIAECYRLLKKGGHLIVDIPFMYPYHGIPDYDDYWRFSPVALKRILELNGFRVLLDNLYGGVLTTAIAIK